MNSSIEDSLSRIASAIDHTLLRADAAEEEILALCAEAKRYHFASVCVNPYWVPAAAEELEGSGVKVCTVIGFPLGANATGIKAAEAVEAVKQGAREIDMVMNIGELKSGHFGAVAADIAAVAAAAHRGGAILKVIIETSLLDDGQKETASKLAKESGAEFVKTSTGLSTGGATVHDVALMRRAVGPEMGVKASGGIRTLEDVHKMIAAGATRIGASAGVKIMQEAAGTAAPAANQGGY